MLVVLQQFADPTLMVESFKKAELVEMESMRAMRAKNMEKHRQDDSADVRFCLCRKGASGLMIQCELCKDWFHGRFYGSMACKGIASVCEEK